MITLLCDKRDLQILTFLFLLFNLQKNDHETNFYF